MLTPLEIAFTPKAKITLKAINLFILQRFGQLAADNFSQKLKKTLLLIAVNPLMFKSSVIDENIRIGLITKQTSVFYLVTATEIQLLYFWDNRQEPQFY